MAHERQRDCSARLHFVWHPKQILSTPSLAEDRKERFGLSGPKLQRDSPQFSPLLADWLGSLFFMPRLTSDELQAARMRSGNLGGRPRKPTVDEARAEALERLVPKSIRVLEEHLDSGRPDAWRAAAKVLEYSWGRPPEHVPSAFIDEADLDVTMISELPTAQLVQLMKARRRASAEATVRPKALVTARPERRPSPAADGYPP